MMSLKGIVKVAITGIALILLTICTLFFCYDSANNVSKGNIKYSKTCGWINWEHAMPKGTKFLLEDIRKKTDTVNGGFIIKYSQKMKYPVFGKFLVAETSSKYEIPLTVTPQQENDAALVIFMEVSEKFEQMQGSFPFNLVPEAQNSSFRSGDLTGNLLSYYLALHSNSLTEVEKKMEFIPVSSAVSLWNNERIKRDEVWTITPSGSFLDSIIEQRKNSSIHPVLIKNERRFYLEDI